MNNNHSPIHGLHLIEQKSPKQLISIINCELEHISTSIL